MIVVHDEKEEQGLNEETFYRERPDDISGEIEDHRKVFDISLRVIGVLLCDDGVYAPVIRSNEYQREIDLEDRKNDKEFKEQREEVLLYISG